jgi:hypothetical protein
VRAGVEALGREAVLILLLPAGWAVNDCPIRVVQAAAR